MERQKNPLTQQVALPVLDSIVLPALVAGVDEVGRGALFGPVVAAAVILSAEAVPGID
jgi:ribonuclease HII